MDSSRYSLFKKFDNLIESTLGYEEFTKGYEYYGFNVQKNNSVVYREWAPNAVTASLVGDFSKYYFGHFVGGGNNMGVFFFFGMHF